MAAILDNDPTIQDLAKIVRDKIAAEKLDEAFDNESTREDLAAEVVYAITGFDNWYFDSDDLRNGWVAKDSPAFDPNSDIYKAVKSVVDEALEELRDPDVEDSLPFEPDADKLVNDLVSILDNWKNWYYDYKVDKDTVDWYERKGIHEDIYLSDDPYGDPDSDQGVSDIFDDENEPWGDRGMDPEETELYSQNDTDPDAVEGVFASTGAIQLKVGGFLGKCKTCSCGHLVEYSSEFHLTGQHNQCTHGGGGTCEVPAKDLSEGKEAATGDKAPASKATSGGSGGGGGSDTGGRKPAKLFKDRLSPDQRAVADRFSSSVVSGEDAKITKSHALRNIAIGLAIPVVATGLLVGAGVGFKVYQQKKLETGLKETVALYGSKAISTTAADGSTINLRDATGKLTKEQSDALLGSLKEVYDRVPVEGGPPEIHVLTQQQIAKNGILGMVAGQANGFVIAGKNPKTIYVNSDVAFSPDKEAQEFWETNAVSLRNGLQGHMMPSFLQNGDKNGPSARYLIHHEYGHVHDFSTPMRGKGSKRINTWREVTGRGEGGIARAMRKHELSYRNGMSNYGATNPFEGYAEAFAEWHLTKGGTENAAARYYAEQYGW